LSVGFVQLEVIFLAIGFVTAAEMQDQLGGVPLERIRIVPPPGLATETDVLRIQDTEGRTCELIDGVLVEKAMGYFESRLAAVLIAILDRFLEQNDLGIVLAPDGALRILGDQIRAPDVAFLSWRHFPGRILPREPVPALVPDLAVEILSEGNTAREIERKLDDYFAAGVALVWIVDPRSESAEVYMGRDNHRALSLADSFEGGSVLPGFHLPLRHLFEKAGRRSGGKQ
jgi:Uma2 family endonuclease